MIASEAAGAGQVIIIIINELDITQFVIKTIMATKWANWFVIVYYYLGI